MSSTAGVVKLVLLCGLSMFCGLCFACEPTGIYIMSGKLGGSYRLVLNNGLGFKLKPI